MTEATGFLWFFRKSKKSRISAARIQRALDQHQQPMGLEELPVDAILDTLLLEFPNVTLLRDKRTSVLQELDESEGEFCVEWGPSHFQFTFYGDAEKHMNRVVDVMTKHGVPCFDAAELKMYSLRSPPRFRPLSEKEKDSWHRLGEAVAEEIDHTKQSTGHAPAPSEVLSRLVRTGEFERFRYTGMHGHSRLEAAEIEEFKSDPAYRRLGLSDRLCELAIRQIKLGLKKWWDIAPSSQVEACEWQSEARSDGQAVFALGCLSYPKLPKSLASPRFVASQILRAIHHYFFGEWETWTFCGDERRPRSDALEMYGWFGAYRDGLALNAILHDWTAFDRLVAWLRPNLPPERAPSPDEGPSAVAYQYWLAAQLAGHDIGDSQEQIKLMESDENPRARMLLAAGRELFRCNANSFTVSLVEYLKFYLDHDIQGISPSSCIAMEASTLWHLAHRCGLGEIALPPGLAILIARP